jgi:hypothetical protein
MPIIYLSFEAYLKEKGISPSAFKKESIRTPAHFKSQQEANAKNLKPRKCTELGSSFHAKILTPEIYKQEVAELSIEMFPSGFVATMAGYPNFTNAFNKGIKDKFIANNPDKLILLPDQVDIMRKMIANTNAMPGVRRILDKGNGSIETSIKLFAEFDIRNEFVRFIDIPEDEFQNLPEETKKLFLRFKIRPDYFSNQENRYAADLKTSKTSDPELFPKEIETYGYHIQAACVLDVLSAIHGVDYDTFFFIVCENEEPYSPMIFPCTDRMIEYARDEYKEKLSWIKKAIDSNKYPSYEIFADPQYTEEGVKIEDPLIPIDMPAWYYKKRDEHKYKMLNQQLNDLYHE